MWSQKKSIMGEMLGEKIFTSLRFFHHESLVKGHYSLPRSFELLVSQPRLMYVGCICSTRKTYG